LTIFTAIPKSCYTLYGYGLYRGIPRVTEGDDNAIQLPNRIRKIWLHAFAPQLARGVLSASAASFLPNAAHANDLPSSLQHARDQFINYIISLAQAQGIAPTQQLVLNSLILPLDLSTDTPYYNDELFRLYADSTFSAGVQAIQRSTPASQAARFSFQYQTLVQ
jgi:hypothetical protein